MLRPYEKNPEYSNSFLRLFTLKDAMPILFHFLKPMERILNFCENLHP